MMNKFKKARPTEYRGTLFRSKSEACYAKWLSRQGVEWIYEPSRYAAGDYVPDFVVRIPGSNFRAIIEYKPAMVTETYISEYKNRVQEMQVRDQSRVLTYVRRGAGGSQTERLERVIQATGCTEGLLCLRSDKGELIATVRPATHSGDLRERVTAAWVAEGGTSCCVKFEVFGGVVTVTPLYLIHCGSFFEDSGVQQISYDPETNAMMTRKEWLGQDNFAERLEISRTRFDLADIL